MAAEPGIDQNRSLASGFLRSSERFPSRPALEVDGATLSYAKLRERSAAIAATIQVQEDHGGVPMAAVLAHRSTVAFSGILGTLLSGRGYVPLNPNFPAERLRNILGRSRCKLLVVGSEAEATLHDMLVDFPERLTIILPESESSVRLQQDFPEHEFVGAAGLAAPDDWKFREPDTTDIAYLLFTSGSTGQPKGVPIQHRSIRHFIDVMVERYEVTEHDRFSQMFELVFDLSLFDLFVAWERGACVCCPNKGDAQMPARYIRQSGITIWFSVPSLAFGMRQMRMLRPGYYPGLRLSLFCGEALMNDVCEAWAVAAPGSVIENLYGPTEVTLACTLYRWSAQTAPGESDHGLVPIGYPYPGMTALIVDEKLLEVAPGEAGELLMSGPQVAPGYWNDPEKTAASFVVPPGREATFYRTGDLVRRPKAGAEPIRYLGRLDHQIKIRGNRVELGEIEAVLREVTGAQIAVAVGWPRTASGADGIVAFVAAPERPVGNAAAKQQLADVLPSYMVPKAIHVVDDMPLNANGKVDRKALLTMLESVRVSTGARRQ